MSDKSKLKPGQRVQSRSAQVRTYCKLLDQSISRWIDAVTDDTPGPSRIKEERMHEIADEAKYLAGELAAIAIVWNVPDVVATFRAMLADKVSPYHVYVDSLGDSDWTASITKNVQPLRDAVKQMRIQADFVDTSKNVYQPEIQPENDRIATLDAEQITESQFKVLKRLCESPVLLKGPDAYVDVGERAGKTILAGFEKSGLVHRPKGKKSGWGPTERGKNVFSRANQMRTKVAP